MKKIKIKNIKNKIKFTLASLIIIQIFALCINVFYDVTNYLDSSSDVTTLETTKNIDDEYNEDIKIVEKKKNGTAAKYIAIVGVLGITGVMLFIILIKEE